MGVTCVCGAAKRSARREVDWTLRPRDWFPVRTLISTAHYQRHESASGVSQSRCEAGVV